MTEDLLDRVHLNLVDSSLQLFGLDPGAEVERTEAWALAAGSPDHPAISNVAFRTGEADAEALVDRARGFFARRGRGFSFMLRGREAADRDLEAAATAAGLSEVYAMPEMTLAAPLPAEAPPPGVAVRRIAAERDAEDYWRICAAAYPDVGFPPEVFGHYTRHEGLRADNLAAFLADLDGEPVAAAMTIVTRGVAGIYWVAALGQARGRGVGRAVTAAAVEAGFGLGADLASLQASPMGRPVYERMGFEAIFDYRLLMMRPPRSGAAR